METKILKIDRSKLEFDKEYKQAAFLEAAKIIREGGLVAFPTETVYGLGADATNIEASKKIYEAKGRPSDNPLIVHISNAEDIKKYAVDIPDEAYKLAENFWPGALTIILKKNEKIPYQTSGGLDTVGLRVPSDIVARYFIEETKTGIAAPSANTSGRPSPTNASHVIEDMQDKIDMVIDAGSSFIGLESTIVDLTQNPPLLLRPGAISLEMLKKVIPAIEEDKSLNKKPKKDLKPKAPGMKYRHYAPTAELIIVDGKNTEVIEFINNKIMEHHNDKKRVGLILSEELAKELKADEVKIIGKKDNYNEIAQNLFSTLRDFDKLSVDIIYSESFANIGIGSAIMNRLIKAAGYKVVKIGEK